jgi:hypothetical protein
LLIVQLVTVSVPEELIPPPVELLGTLFPLMVLFEMLSTPLLEIPPPETVFGKKVEFPLMVLSTIVIVPDALATPPPKAALFPVTLHRVRLTIPLVPLRTPAPVRPDAQLLTTESTKLTVPNPLFTTPESLLPPLLSVRPETVTVGRGGVLPDTESIPNGLGLPLPPLMVSWPTPGP